MANAAIRRGLALGDPPSEAGRTPLVVHPQACGLMPGIDPLRFNQLPDQLEVDRFQVVQAREEGTS